MDPFSQLSLRFRSFTIVLICILACWARSTLLCQTIGPDTASHFAYDVSTPLDVTQVSTEKHGTVMVQEITYMSPVGGLVPASLVFASGSGKSAAVIWGHWLMPNVTNSNKSEFLQEAIALASAGVVSLLIDAPQARPGFKASPNPVLIAQQVIDLRRGVDLLLSRSDVDPKRIAYVGHSWDAGTGAHTRCNRHAVHSVCVHERPAIDTTILSLVRFTPHSANAEERRHGQCRTDASNECMG